MCFQLFDQDKNGKISLDEFKILFMKNVHVDQKLWQQMIQEVDTNKDGFIDFAEFKAILQQLH